MRADGVFIAIEVTDEAASDSQLAAKLSEACPVDIFAQGENGVELVERNLDECVLCGLCLTAADGRSGQDPIPVRVIKLYDNEATLTQA